MFPEYAGLRLLQSNLAPNATTAAGQLSFIVANLKRGPLCLIGSGVSTIFRHPYAGFQKNEGKRSSGW
jgi:hypothetical protein